MSNHASKAVVRTYAWHHPQLMEMLKSIGQQARIEQALRRQEREARCR